MASSNPRRRRRPKSTDERTHLIRNDGSHRDDREHSLKIAATDDLYDSPAYALGLDDPHVLERLERLDDAVFESIAGKSSAVERLRQLWAEVPTIVGPELVEESRQAYLQHALNKWRECDAAEPGRNPRLAVMLLDVIAVLIE